MKIRTSCIRKPGNICWHLAVSLRAVEETHYGIDGSLEAQSEGKKGNMGLTEVMTINGTNYGILQLTFRRLLST